MLLFRNIAGGCLRFRQRLLVNLPVRCHRHLFQLHIDGGHHILREFCADVSFQSIDINRTASGEVGAQVFRTGDGAHHDPYLLHIRIGGNGMFYLAQFDTQTSQLNLMVGTSEDDHFAIGQPLGIVAGTVDTSAEVVDKTLAGHLLKMMVATSHAASTNIEFAHYTDREFVAITVNHKLNDVQLRLSYRDGLGVCQFTDV